MSKADERSRGWADLTALRIIQRANEIRRLRVIGAEAMQGKRLRAIAIGPNVEALVLAVAEQLAELDERLCALEVRR